MGALVEITAVLLAEPLPAQLSGRHLDEPRPGAVLDAEAVEVTGWALGNERRALAVEFSERGEPFWRSRLRTKRPDLAEAFPARGDAGQAGFRTTLDLLGTAPRFEVSVAAVLEGQTRLSLGVVRGRHCWRRERSAAFAELVTVVIACPQQTKYLGEAIESVLAQSHPYLEVVVVDNGSADDASAVASRYPDVRCIRDEPGGGAAAARNVGIRNTNGDFLVFLDADDRLLPGGIAAGLAVLEARPECAAAIGAYRRTAFDGRPLEGDDQPVVDRDQYEELMRSNWARFPARTIYRRALFEHVRCFDATIEGAADFDFNLAVARQFPIAGHATPVAERPDREEGMSDEAGLMLTQTLTALRNQRPYVRRDPARRRAYREGRRHWRRYWGDQLATEARERYRERRFGAALRGAVKLLRHRPGALPRLFVPGRPRAA